MVTYDRWFILPVVELPPDENGEIEFGPKYVVEDVRGGGALEGFTSAGPFSRQEVEDAGYTHLLAFNDAEEWRVVKTWGEGNGAWNTLNSIHAFNHDTETLADHVQDVVSVLDQRFGSGNWNLD